MWVRLFLLQLALCSALLGCQRSKSQEKSTKTPRQEVVVFAASSLTEAFQELETAFEEKHPTVDVRLSFAGSQVLRVQIEQGASAAIFASANGSHLEALHRKQLIARRGPLARNSLVIVVPAQESSSVGGVRDLPQVDRIVVGDDQVPLGSYTREFLHRAQASFGREFMSAVQKKIVSRESNARLVRAKVELGEADAGVVYRSDAASSNRVRAIELPESLNVTAQFVIGLVKERSSLPAQMFFDFAISSEGRRLLVKHGFLEGRP